MVSSPTDSATYISPPSSVSASSHFLRDSMSSISTAPTSYSNHIQKNSVDESEGILGSQEGSVRGKGIGERARGLIGLRFGSGRGPPPSTLPPLPPIPASAEAGPSRANVFQRASSRLSTNPLRQSSMPAPKYPPPSTSLPQPPSQTNSTNSRPPPSPSTSMSRALAPISQGRHQRQESTSSHRSAASSGSISASPNPNSPTLNSLTPTSPTFPPPIAARSSSLASQGSASRDAAANSNHAEGSSVAVTERRIPSRQLLQTALDLAQRAVEMDQGNDVVGALMAYREAVTRLKAVMERVGMEGKEGKKGKNGKAEEEGRTLKGIHDAYVARVLLLQSYESGQESRDDAAPTSSFPTPPNTLPSPGGRISSSNSTTISSPFSSSRSTTASTIPTLNSSPGPVNGRTTDRTPVPFIFPTDRTPRPSMESSDGGRGIGAFMMADQSFDASSPGRLDFDSTPQPTRPDTPTRPSRNNGSTDFRSASDDSVNTSRQALSSENGIMMMNGASSSTVMLKDPSSSLPVLDNPPVRRESLARTNDLGLGHPTSPPRFVETSPSINPDTPVIADHAPPPKTPETARRHRHQMPSVGIEDELGLTTADGVQDKGDMEEIADTLEPRTTASNGNLSRAYSRTDSIEKTLPPIPSDISIPTRRSSHSRQSSLSRLGQLISETTSKGTISQRRISKNGSNLPTIENGDSTPPLPTSKSMAFPTGSSGNDIRSISDQPRTRSKSQPGQRPGDIFQAESADDVPPLPVLRNKASFHSQHPHQRHSRIPSENLAPPIAASFRSASPSSLAPIDTSRSISFSGSLISPVPELQPDDVLHRPFHLLRTIQLSMDPEGPGAYLTGAIHIPSSIWESSAPSSSKSSRGPGQPPGSSSGTGIKITAQDTKVRIMDALLLHLEIIRHTGAPLLEGPREVSYGVPGVAAPRVGVQAIASIGHELLGALDGLEEEMDGVYKTLVKAGVSVGAWKGKKASANSRSWGSKVVRGMDKITNSKAMDSPDKYVDLLANLCANVQTLDDHLLNFTGPCTPAYHYIAEPGYRALEQRLHRSAEFARVVLVPFVLDDFKQFFYRYLKAGMRYIEE